jgi:hypothetical protein
MNVSTEAEPAGASLKIYVECVSDADAASFRCKMHMDIK